MPELHAKLSPSSAERWMNCPGSVVLSLGLEQETSAFAEEGTRAHELAAAILLRQEIKPESAEMEAFVRTYTEHVEAVFAEGESKWIEHKVQVNEDVWGTADALVWQPDAKKLHVIDLKYGAGVPVEVVGNLQLKIYALAALLTFKLPVRVVAATIAQPRIPHPDGFIRTKEFDAVDLLDFHADLQDAVKAVEMASIAETRNASWNDAYLNPTEKGCKWCPAAAICPKVKQQAQAVAKKVFTVDKPYDPLELARTLDFLPVLEGFIKSVREFAYAEAEKGRDIPDYKLVQKRASRQWRNEEEASAKMSTLLGEKAFKPKELLTPPAIEKLLPKDARSILDELTSKESSGHTLVHASDKREAIRVDAQSAFAAYLT